MSRKNNGKVAQAKALKIARKYADFVNQFISVKACYLFGSYAQTDALRHRWSDIDIAIVSDDFEHIPIDLAGKMLAKATNYVSTQIEAVPIPTSEIENPTVGTIGSMILKTGIVV